MTTEGGSGGEDPKAQNSGRPRNESPGLKTVFAPFSQGATLLVGTGTACRVQRDKSEYESAVQPVKVPVSGVNTGIHPETNPHMHNFLGHKTTHTYRHAYTHVGKLTDMSALKVKCSHRATRTHTQAGSASESS